jgi:hypothetical protein
MNSLKFRLIATVVFVVIAIIGFAIYESNKATPPPPQGDPNGLVIH